jgi:Fe-S oxidoreductase
MVKALLEEGMESASVQDPAWSCLTCGLCDVRCPSGIRFSRFVQALRSLSKEQGFSGHLSHTGALQGIMRMQASVDLDQNRLGWVSPELKICDKGDILYFVGCLPYFDIFFAEMGLDLCGIARDAVKILNTLGVTPAVMSDERCCGHDLLWTGEHDAFNALRKLNIESFQKAGAKTILTGCAECSYTLKHYYSDFPSQVMHLTEYLEKMGFRPQKPLKRVVTYQDPCRLSRYQRLDGPPRALLESVGDLKEMRHRGTGAWCCGNSAWLHCDRYSKQMQVERLLEAKATGADLMVTACPKCRIHLTCAQKDVNALHDLDMPLKDIVSLIAESL